MSGLREKLDLQHRSAFPSHVPKPNVLIVDDLPANLLALQALVQDLGYNPVLAHSGSEALKRVLESEFACVLLDLRMPGIDGLETAALIRKRKSYKDLPLIFLTSREPSLVELSQGYSLGAVDFLLRPMDAEILKSKIRAIAQLSVERGIARQEKEEEIRKGRERLGLLFEQLPIALWSTDENLKLTFCAGSLYGHGDVPRPEALIGRSLTELLPAQEGREHRILLAHRQVLLGHPQTYTEERYGRLFEGTLRPLRDPQGNIKGVLGAAVDITERKFSEDALRQGKERFELLMEGIKDYAIIFLDPEGHVEGWNGGAERIIGYWAAEAAGMPYVRFFPPEDQVAGGKAERLLREAAKSGSVRDQGWRVRKDGSRFWADVLVTALRRPDGILRGYAKITRDLTERHEADEKIRRLNENLERLVQTRTASLEATVEELKAFNHTVAHDVRAPLRTITGMGQILLEDFRGKLLNDQAESYLKGIIQAARRMDQMTQDLLAYSRLSREHVGLEALDPAQVLKETLAEMAPDLEARKAFVERGSIPAPVQANRLLVKHVLMNLLYNAIKFVGPGTQPKIRISGEAQGKLVRITVADNGIGVAGEDQERIFGVFERLHSQEAYPGTGIGLAIVKRAVERMGGRVGVESAPGQGSRFWFELFRA